LRIFGDGLPFSRALRFGFHTALSFVTARDRVFTLHVTGALIAAENLLGVAEFTLFADEDFRTLPAVGLFFIGAAGDFLLLSTGCIIGGA
jgi:hypothetical protein